MQTFFVIISAIFFETFSGTFFLAVFCYRPVLGGLPCLADPGWTMLGLPGLPTSLVLLERGYLVISSEILSGIFSKTFMDLFLHPHLVL